MLKNEKRKSQLKYELGKLMHEYAVPLPSGNFNMGNKETRRLELLGNQKAMWFDHLEHMDEGQEKNKEWENFWGTVDEDMLTYVMNGRIEEISEEKLNQEFPSEVETRENEASDIDEEMTSETEDNRILSKDQILESCSHMNCCLQNYATHQFTYFIY